MRLLTRRQAVRAVSFRALEGLDRRPHLFPDGAAQKAAHRVCLPAGRLHEFRQDDGAGPFQQSRILSVLLPPCRAVAGLFAPAAFGAGSAFSGAALALRLATRAFVVGAAVGFLVFFLEVVILSFFLFDGSRRVMTLITLSGRACKTFVENVLEKFTPTIIRATGKLDQ